MKSQPLIIVFPALISFGNSLFVESDSFWKNWKIHFEPNGMISYPQSHKGDLSLNWILSSDGLIYYFCPSHKNLQWARFLRHFIRLTRSVGYLTKGEAISKKKLVNLLQDMHEVDAQLNHKSDLIKILEKLNNEDDISSVEMAVFFGIRR